MDIFGQNWWKKHFCKNLKYFWKIEGVYEIQNGKSHNTQQEGGFTFSTWKVYFEALEIPFWSFLGINKYIRNLMLGKIFRGDELSLQELWIYNVMQSNVTFFKKPTSKLLATAFHIHLWLPKEKYKKTS